MSRPKIEKMIDGVDNTRMTSYNDVIEKRVTDVWRDMIPGLNVLCILCPIYLSQNIALSKGAKQTSTNES